MTTPHESRLTRTSTRAGMLTSAICAICSESRVSCSRMRGNKRAHKHSRLLTLRPERAGMFRRFGRLSIRILPDIVDDVAPPQ
jgi:hypothetical protein